MTLREARCKFTECIAKLIFQAYSLGNDIALAEGMDRKTIKDPTSDHMKGSLHDIGLAQDFDLYKDGVYLVKNEDHLLLGEWWEQLGVSRGFPLRWGGRFKDGNHYSWEWEGRK